MVIAENQLGGLGSGCGRVTLDFESAPCPLVLLLLLLDGLLGLGDGAMVANPPFALPEACTGEPTAWMDSEFTRLRAMTIVRSFERLRIRKMKSRFVASDWRPGDKQIR